MRRERVMFPSGPVRCAGDLYLPDCINGGAPAPGVVMGHSVVMVKEALRPHAEYLVNAGLAVLAIDYKTVGSSEGEPRCQWFPERQVEDMRAGVSCLRARPEVDPEQIGLWGHSTAAGVAVVAGAIDRRIRCVACQNPSMLDAWTALEKARGRAPMSTVRALLQEDDPKLAGYVARPPGSCHPRPPTKRGLGACDRNTGTRRETRFPRAGQWPPRYLSPNSLTDEIWNAAAVTSTSANSRRSS